MRNRIQIRRVVPWRPSKWINAAGVAAAVLCAGPARLAAAASRQDVAPPDTGTRAQYIEVGAAGLVGGYTVIAKQLVLNRAARLTRQTHAYHAAGLSAGLRIDRPSWGIGIRGRAFSGSDHADQRRAENGFFSPAALDSAYTVRVYGASGLVDFDTRYVGVSAGVLAGRLMRGERPLSSPQLIGGVRFGLLSQLFGEIAVLDHDPSPTPYPSLKASVVVVGDGAASYRFGAASAGPFVEAFVVTKNGWVFDPFVSAGESGGFIGSFRVAKRLRFGSRH